MKNNILSIILADDDQDDCMFFKTVIEDIIPATKLIIMHNGEELMNFLTEIKGKLPDVLFLDINMPRKNGFECLTEIRQNQKLKAIPIVMFSTSNSWDTINTIFNNGAHVFIHKPSDFGQLKQLINHALPIATDSTCINKPLKYILNAANYDRPNFAKPGA